MLSGHSQYVTKYPDIPRIEVHTHIGNDYSTIERYLRTFRILETDEMVEGGFFGMNPVKGLDLPKEVLENIYFKNALKLYPGLSRKFIELSYVL